VKRHAETAALSASPAITPGSLTGFAAPGRYLGGFADGNTPNSRVDSFTALRATMAGRTPPNQAMHPTVTRPSLRSIGRSQVIANVAFRRTTAHPSRSTTPSSTSDPLTPQSFQ
jgi:hypothetical protein